MTQFTDLVKQRRTAYAIGKNTELSNKEIADRIREVTQDIPTAFNSQTTRLVVVFGEDNIKLWDHILDVQKDVLEGDMWEMMSGVMQGAKAGIGTVLFFEDRDAVAGALGENERANVYKHHHSANTQYGIWLALTELGLGGSLQHMNIGFEQGFDKSVKEMFNLPASYELIAQMPFGSIEAPANDKDYIDSSEQVRVIGE